MIIEKFTGKYDCLIHTISFEKLDCVLDKEFKIKKGWEYYAFITPDKTGIRHSGKLTKEEKQWVIKQESNEQNRTR